MRRTEGPLGADAARSNLSVGLASKPPVAGGPRGEGPKSQAEPAGPNQRPPPDEGNHLLDRTQGGPFAILRVYRPHFYNVAGPELTRSRAPRFYTSLIPSCAQPCPAESAGGGG